MLIGVKKVSFLKIAANYIVDKFSKEISAAEVSKKKDLIIGKGPYKDIKQGIRSLHKEINDGEYRQNKALKGIETYAIAVKMDREVKKEKCNYNK